MKKRMLLVLVLIVCAVALCACQDQGGTKYTPVEQGGNTAVQNTAQPQQNLWGNPAPAADDIDFDDGSYDPTSEEGRGEDLPDFVVQDVQTPAPTVRGEYAGATPVVIDPFDKPTPTPVPPLSFTFQTYDATKLRLAFDAPVGWVVDESVEGAYVLRNPDPAMNYKAELVVTAASAGSQMSKKDMENHVEAWLDAIGEQGFKSYSPSQTASRTLMDQTGIYANYTATTADGVRIAGRIHVTCVNKVMYTVHISYPAEYTDTYVDNVYKKLRNTIKISQ